MSDLQALAPCWAGVNLDILFLGFILSQFVYWKLKCESTEKWPLRLFMVSFVDVQMYDGMWTECDHNMLGVSMLTITSTVLVRVCLYGTLWIVSLTDACTC